MVQFPSRFGMVENIPGDPRPVSRDGTKKSRAKSGNSKLARPDFERDFFVPSRLIAPGSPRMCGYFVIANSSFQWRKCNDIIWEWLWDCLGTQVGYKYVGMQWSKFSFKKKDASLPCFTCWFKSSFLPQNTIFLSSDTSMDHYHPIQWLSGCVPDKNYEPVRIHYNVYI